MTAIKFQKDSKGNITNVLLTDASLYYCKIRRPQAIYDDRNVKFNQARKEYSVELAVSEEVADAWDEVFAKQPSKKYTNAKFREKYKLEEDDDLPFPKEKKQFTIKVTQKAQDKEGDAIRPSNIPRILMADPDNPKKGLDITFDRNVGNGSKGHASARVNTNDYGSFAYLNKLKINELVEYEDSDGGLSDEEKDAFGFDDVEFAESSGAGSVVVDGEEEDSPFDETPEDDGDY